MALDTYDNLRATIAAWLWRPNDTDLTTYIPDMVKMAEAQMNRRLRVRQMVTRAEAAFSTDAEFINDPGSDMLEPISLTLEVSESDIRYLERLAPERLLTDKARYGVTTAGEPQFYAHVGAALQFLPVSDDDYTGELTYYTKIPALSASNPSNWVLASYPDAYLYGSLVHSAPFLQDDERITIWGTMFQSVLDEIQRANRVPAGKLRTDLALLVGSGSYNIATDG